MVATLMLSQGVPMIVAGDEFRRTQNGNNNAYCQDNEISWLNWDLAEVNSDLIHFCRSLIQFRRSQPTVRRKHFLSGVPDSKDGWADVSWYSATGTAIQWHEGDHPLTCLFAAPQPADDPQDVGRDVLLLINSSNHGCRFMLPAIAKSKTWRLFVDTAAEAPNDIFENLDGPEFSKSHSHTLPSKSLAVYVAEQD